MELISLSAALSTISTFTHLQQLLVRPWLGDPADNGDVLIEPPDNRDTVEKLSSDNQDEYEP